MPAISRRRRAAALLCGFLPAFASMLATSSAASAADACYEAFAVSGGASLFFVRLQTRSAGTLVPENEGGAVGPAQTLFEVDGKATARTGFSIGGQPVVNMSLLTGSALVVAGRGAQMSLLRNFGRGEQGAVGFSVLDCGSATASSAPSSWICRGVTVVTASSVSNARDFRLSKVANAALIPQCRDFGLRAN
jgi:hypothetical protein